MPQDSGGLSACVDADELGGRCVSLFVCGLRRFVCLLGAGECDEHPVDRCGGSDLPRDAEIRGRGLPGDSEARGEVRGNEGGDTCVARIPCRPVGKPGQSEGQSSDDENGDGRDELANRAGKATEGCGHRALLIGPGVGVRPTMRSPGEGANARMRSYHGELVVDMRATMRSS